MASLHPGSLAVIPSNISCASYAAMYEIIFLKSKCKETLVDEDLVCAVLRSTDHNSNKLCLWAFPLKPCAILPSLRTPVPRPHISQLTTWQTLMKCSLESQTTYPVEVWTLLFQKASSALDQALESFATMAPNNSNPSLSHALEALGQVRIASFSQAQLQSVSFVSSWFMTNIRPFLASSSPNFLFCLSSKNFSCDTYRTVIKAFSSQAPFMDRERQQTVLTYFIKPFLSRNDSSGKGRSSSSIW
ncbi:uncharacterized protein LOC108873928 [Lates calcarifer]|uniref:Uncharacterized protein LOC108873928 n=1 Tax=Lates calcarifer TaxID=8187 RepID=A0AAJ8B3J7_LATCA|nr:uncharacterized protein LOC108873928 [Lates calcarifer]